MNRPPLRVIGPESVGEAVDERVKMETDTPLDGGSAALSIESASCSRFLGSPPKPRDYVVNGFLPRLNVGIIAAPGGTGKGYLTLQLGLSVATGIPFLGKFKIERPGGVLYLNAEDDDEEIHRRFHACFRETVRNKTELAEKSARTVLLHRFYSPAITGRARLSLFPDTSGDARRRILVLAKGIPDLRLIVLDPANRLMSGDFNKVEEVTPFIQTLEEIAFATGATVLLVTHTNKGSQGGDRDQKHSAGAVLGSQSFTNAARWVATLSTFDESMRKKYKFSGPLEKYVSLRIPKANYLPSGFGELHFLRIGNDDHGLGGGPLRLVDLSEKRSEVTPEQVAEWVASNPGNGYVTAVDGICQRFGTPKHKTEAAVNDAITVGIIEARASGKKNQKLLFPPNLEDFSQDKETLL